MSRGSEQRSVRPHGLAHQNHRLIGGQRIDHRDDVVDEGAPIRPGRHPGAVPVSALVHQHSPVIRPQ
ncbi:hypothetical protein RCG68_09965 [Kocuria sp. CPCC 205290]